MKPSKITGLLELIDSYNTELFNVIPVSSREQYVSLRRYAAAFLSAAYGKEEISLQNADDLLPCAFKRFLLAKGYSQRTAHRNYRLLQRMIGSVNEAGMLTGSMATRKYSVRHETLTEKELLRMLGTRMPNECLQRIRDVFIFSSFTGLRHDDIRGLTRADLSMCGDGRACLVIGRKMTGIISYIPLLDIPLHIIVKYCGWDEESLLPCITGEKTNCYLKEIGRACGLSKSLYFTMARNTFAGIVAYANGMSMKCISRVMGDNGNPSFEQITQEDKDSIEAEFTALDSKLGKYSNVFAI